MKPPPGFGHSINEYLNHYITVADAKAAGVITVDLALAGYLLSKVPTITWPLIFHWIALSLLLVSGLVAIHTLIPRTPKVGSSLIFWEDIRTRTTMDAYLQELAHVDEAEVERQYAAQNYFVSDVLSKKYVLVRRSMRTLVGAIVFTTLRTLIGG